MGRRKRSRTTNHYKIEGDITIIYLKKRSGDTVEAIIDTEDLERVKHIRWYDANNYVRGFTRQGEPTYLLHRLLMGNPENLFVDHINHNPLDNRKVNLRLATIGQNTQNMKGAMKNNKSCGVRGVTWCKSTKKWMARITVNHQRINVGYFTDLEEAKRAVELARANYMPFSYEAYKKSHKSV